MANIINELIWKSNLPKFKRSVTQSKLSVDEFGIPNTKFITMPPDYVVL